MIAHTRAAFLIGTPVAFSGLLWMHPMIATTRVCAT